MMRATEDTAWSLPRDEKYRRKIRCNQLCRFFLFFSFTPDRNCCALHAERKFYSFAKSPRNYCGKPLLQLAKISVNDLFHQRTNAILGGAGGWISLSSDPEPLCQALVSWEESASLLWPSLLPCITFSASSRNRVVSFKSIEKKFEWTRRCYCTHGTMHKAAVMVTK